MIPGLTTFEYICQWATTGRGLSKNWLNRFLETQSLAMLNICSVCVNSFLVSNDQA